MILLTGVDGLALLTAIAALFFFVVFAILLLVLEGVRILNKERWTKMYKFLDLVFVVGMLLCVLVAYEIIPTPRTGDYYPGP